MDLLFEILIILLLIIVANLIVRAGEPRYGRAFDRFLLLLSLPMLLAGIFFILVNDEQLAQFTSPDGEQLFLLISDSLALGITLQLMAVWGIVVSFQSTRRSLSRFIPVNPESAVHSLALICVGWLLGATLIQVSQSSLEQIIESIGPVPLSGIVFQETLLAVIGIIGVGFIIRRSLKGTWRRLGLGPLTTNQLFLGVAWIIALVALQSVIGLMWEFIDPEQAELVGELNLDLLTGLDTVGEWLVLALAAGIGEELLFWGALQPVFGLWVTSILFAMIHVQYGFFTPATIALLLIGLSLGYIRKNYNTTLAIFVHVGYDFVLGMIALLALSA